MLIVAILLKFNYTEMCEYQLDYYNNRAALWVDNYESNLTEDIFQIPHFFSR